MTTTPKEPTVPTLVTAPTYDTCPTCGGPTQPEYPAGMCPDCITHLGFVTTADQPPGTTEWEQDRQPFTDWERTMIRHYELSTWHIADSLAGGAGIVHGDPETVLLDAYRNPGPARTPRDAILWDLQVIAEWERALRSTDGDIPVSRTDAMAAYWGHETWRCNATAHRIKDAALACLLDTQPDQS